MDNIIFQDTTVNRIVFHFNKAFLTDPSIPMWVVKHKGQTYYVNHFESSIGFSTKETPDNNSTKGSLQLKGTLLIKESNNQTEAIIS